MAKKKTTDGVQDLQASGVPSPDGGPTDDALESSKIHVIVTSKPGESADSLLRRFRQAVKDSGILEKIEEMRYYIKPSKRKRQLAKERWQKIAREQRLNR